MIKRRSQTKKVEKKKKTKKKARMTNLLRIKRSSSSKKVASGVDLRAISSTLEELKTRYSLK
jgi:hypothetical protein